MDSSLGSLVRTVSARLFDEGDLDAVEECFAPGYVAHVTDQDLSGRPAVRRVIDLYRNAFSDLQVHVEVLVETADRVAWQRTLRGTQLGAFKGFPATDRPIVWRELVTSRFVEGLIVEEWVVTDLAERLLLARKRSA
jgi:predicted ester cyclase